MYITVGDYTNYKGGDIHLHAGKTTGNDDGGTIEVIAGDTMVILVLVMTW